ncbi:hypothetical protein [Mesorhizobium sp. LSJC285A00]|uniref:hypothetical protein n=1 Tax=Mesorhizobium sp. LSJC285A00 TaxID=1287338 RepID=UPI000417460F|nr:hypothetical protein [Mesorhizobium sp. LSJC285A00]
MISNEACRPYRPAGFATSDLKSSLCGALKWRAKPMGMAREENGEWYIDVKEAALASVLMKILGIANSCSSVAVFSRRKLCVSLIKLISSSRKIYISTHEI